MSGLTLPQQCLLAHGDSDHFLNTLHMLLLLQTPDYVVLLRARGPWVHVPILSPGEKPKTLWVDRWELSTFLQGDSPSVLWPLPLVGLSPLVSGITQARLLISLLSLALSILPSLQKNPISLSPITLKGRNKKFGGEIEMREEERKGERKRGNALDQCIRPIASPFFDFLLRKIFWEELLNLSLHVNLLCFL